MTHETLTKTPPNGRPSIRAKALKRRTRPAGEHARRRLFLGLFTLNSPTVHGGYRPWAAPDSRSGAHEQLAPWVDLVRLLESACFDALFIGDVSGVFDNFKGGHDVFAREGLYVPVNDPAALLSALAAASSDLGLVVTSSILQEHPFQFARKMSTLDHLSGGRIGWNIVTGASAAAARNFGHPGLLELADRYAWAEEYCEVTYKLWEGSWEDDAVVRDVARGRYSDGAKIHKINHRGRRYSVDGPHLVAPSPQRTPLLFQAGSSGVGRAFAARHAEIMFLACATTDDARATIQDTRSRAAALGRRPQEIKFVQALAFVVGSTEQEAQAKKAALEREWEPEGLLAHRSSNLGIDLGKIDLDTPLRELESEILGVKHVVEGLLAKAPPGSDPTFADAIRLWQAQPVVGTPEQIVSEIEGWQDAGIDGIMVSAVDGSNFPNPARAGGLDQFIEHVVPELRRRGLAQQQYTPGTLRQKVFQSGPHISLRHVARSYRSLWGAGIPDARSSHTPDDAG